MEKTAWHTTCEDHRFNEVSLSICSTCYRWAKRT